MNKRIFFTANFPQVCTLKDVIVQPSVEQIFLVTNKRDNPFLEELSKNKKLKKVWDYYETQSICPNNFQSYYELTENEYKSISHLILIAIDMLDRNNLRKFNSYKYRNNFVHKMIRYSLSILKDNKINLMIFSSTPHTIFHFCFYIAAEILKIPKYLFYRFPIVDDIQASYYCYTDIFNHSSTMITNEQNDVCLKYFDKKNYLFQNSFSGVPNVSRLNFLSKINNFRKGIYKEWTLRMGLYELFKLLKKRMPARKSQADLPTSLMLKKYVFFPLHYQPECSTNPLGGRFRDQLAAIRLIQKNLDSSYKIILKPHPRRSLVDIDLKEIGDGRTFLPSNEISTEDLVSGSSAVITITGTTGFFAAIRGLPVICFGNIFYENFPNVLKIRDVQDLKKIEGFITNKRCDEVLIRSKLLDLSKYAIFGARDNRYIKNQNLDTFENNFNYTKFILKVINK